MNFIEVFILCAPFEYAEIALTHWDVKNFKYNILYWTELWLNWIVLIVLNMKNVFVVIMADMIKKLFVIILKLFHLKSQRSLVT